MLKMRKILTALLSVALLLCSCTALVSCDGNGASSSSDSESTNTGSTHRHVYMLVKTEPTCTEQGYTTYTCGCGKSYVSDYEDATGHDYQDRVCTLCGSLQGSEGLEYVLNDDGESYSVTGIGTVFEEEIFIASTYEGKPVTTIAEGAFDYCASITSVTIESGITSINASAFYYCMGLTSVTIGNGVETIGDNAFAWCGNLTNVNVPDSVIYVGENAFRNCRSLSNLSLGSGIIYIQDWAFFECESLTSVSIAASVTSIGNGVFYNCNQLENIVVDENNANYSSQDGVLFNKDKTELIRYPEGKTDVSYAIPDGVTHIAENAFARNGHFTSIVIPVSVTSIGLSAFSSIGDLTNVYYTGTESEWATLLENTESFNTRLISAPIVYNYVAEQ